MNALQLAHDAKRFWPEIDGVPQLIMHRENAVFRVETTNGPAALRIHRPGYRQKIEIASELAWMAHLAAQGLELPAPIANREGALLCEIADANGNLHVVDLLSWMEGAPIGRSYVPLNFTRDELQTIFSDVGCNLAQLHLLSDAWDRPADFQRHHLDADGFLSERAAWGAFWNASVLSAGERQLMQQARVCAGEKIAALVEAGAGYGLIHADLVRENIFLHEGKTRFIDFDDAGFGFRMFDLAVALVKNRQEPHYQTIKAALFAGYASRRGISPVDESAVDLFLALRDFAYLGWADARRNEASMAPRMEQIRQDTVAAAENFLSLK